MKRAILSCLALALTIPNLPAQARQVAFRTLCIEVANDTLQVMIPGKDPKVGQPVQLLNDISTVVDGTFQTNEAEFFTEKAGADGKPVRELVAKGTLAKSARQLFLFVPSARKEDGKPPYSVVCYDDDTKAFGMGHIREINLAPVPVRFILAGQITPEIPPMRFAQFPHSTKVNDYDMYPVVVEFLSANGQWIKGQSVSWKATDSRREIVVTLVDAKFNQPVVRMYSDFPPWMQEPLPTPKM